MCPVCDGGSGACVVLCAAAFFSAPTPAFTHTSNAQLQTPSLLPMRACMQRHTRVRCIHVLNFGLCGGSKILGGMCWQQRSRSQKVTRRLEGMRRKGCAPSLCGLRLVFSQTPHLSSSSWQPTLRVRARTSKHQLPHARVHAREECYREGHSVALLRARHAPKRFKASAAECHPAAAARLYQRIASALSAATPRPFS